LLDEPFIGLNTSNLQVVCDKLNNLKSSSIILIIAKEIPQEISIDKQLKL